MRLLSKRYSFIGLLYLKLNYIMSLNTQDRRWCLGLVVKTIDYVGTTAELQVCTPAYEGYLSNCAPDSIITDQESEID